MVTSEVRNLALRSSKAAQEIKGLLEGNHQHINTGVDQAEKAGQSMQYILNAIERVQKTINQTNLDQENGLNELQFALKSLEELSQHLVATLHRTVSDLGVQNKNMHHAIAALGA